MSELRIKNRNESDLRSCEVKKSDNTIQYNTRIVIYAR